MSRALSDELSVEGLARLGPANQCDLEPIGRSEAIQPHGVLLGIEPDTLRVQVVSANLAELLGVDADEVLGRPLHEVLGAEGTQVVAGLREVPRLEDVLPLVIPVQDRPGGARPVAPAFDLVGFRADGLLVIELEPVNRRDADLVEFYELFRRALTRLRGIEDVQRLCEVGVEQLRLLAGYDRVMAYRFDDDATGQVVAEASAGGLAYLGMSFPAGDIPRPARALYLRNWFRQIADVEHRPVPLRRLGAAAASHPVDRLDLSPASLRSIAPAHLQYLQNMGVRASASVSLIVEDQLWGLLACHHHTPRWVPPYVRVACETLGRLLSLQLGAAQDRARATRAAELAALSAQVEQVLADSAVLAEGVARVPEALLGMVGADGVVLRLEGTIVTLGATPPPATLAALVDAVARLAGDRHWHTHHLAGHIQGHDYRSSGAAGALYLPLGPPDGDFALWLRSERVESVTWGGRPPQKGPTTDPAAAVTPRASFAAWHEVISGTAPSWTPVELAAAASFGRAVPEIQLRRTQRELAHLALHDALTGLPNRTMFLDRLGHALARSTSPGRTAVMFIDIDRFKSVNDTLGHQAGDTLLGQAAARLSAAIRHTDTAGRMGGDEFVVLCEDLGRPRDALDIATRIIEEFRHPFLLGGTEWRVTASIGLAMFEADPDGSEFLRQADLALYQAKQAGRDQVVVFDRQLSDSLQQAIRTERELADAVRLGELVVHYQPVYDLRPSPGGHPSDVSARPPYGLEALIRWDHPRRGLLSPAEFLPYAEDNALGDAIGDHVLAVVLAQLASWRRDLSAAEPLRVAVNVTVRQLTAPGFADRILRQLAAHRVPANRLSLELTETQLMSDPDRTIGALRLLDAAGVQVAIDDFGTGFSSLAYVRDLPASSLKVDRSFVVGLPGDTRDLAVVTAVIGLAHELGMTTVAEGVETPEQLDCLLQLGCDFAQGFLLGRPVPAAAVPLDM